MYGEGRSVVEWRRGGKVSMDVWRRRKSRSRSRRR